jgi:hypothetical protein
MRVVDADGKKIGKVKLVKLVTPMPSPRRARTWAVTSRMSALPLPRDCSVSASSEWA